MNKIKIYLIAIGVVVLLMFACKKQQPQMTTEVTNPCDCATEVSAEFKMEESGKYQGSLNPVYKEETDTMYSERPLLFTALEDDAEYTWYIGAEVITEKTFWRFFDNTLAGQTLPMTLVVKKKPNKICFPNDDGYDSITKNITIVDGTQLYTTPNHFEGTYRISDTSSVDSIDIVIDFDNNFTYTGGANGGKKIVFYNIGLWNGGEEAVAVITARTYRKLWFSGDGCLARGELSLFSGSDSVEIKITGPELLPQCTSSFHYYGRKL